MSIRYITEGDESRAKGLLGEGRHQLSILKNLMSFQKLQQLQRVVKFNDGTIIKCLSCFGQDVINIFVPVELIKKKKRIIRTIYYCWCNCCFTGGIIIEVINNYDSVGTYTENGKYIYDTQYLENQYYPKCCKSGKLKVRRYNGIRYKVRVCLKDKFGEFICIPSDFMQYKKDDKVLLLILRSGKAWGIPDCYLNCPPSEDGKLTGEGACKGKRRPMRKQDATVEAAYGVTLTDAPDGTYLILPFIIPSLPSSVEQIIE